MAKHSKNKNVKQYKLIFFDFNILTIMLFLLLVVIYFKDKSENSPILSTSTLNNNKETDTVSAEQKEENRFEGLTMTNENVGVPVLYYHSVDPSEANEVIISPEKLKEQLTFIKDSGYTTLTISELNDYILNNTPIPEKSIVITFDDGYELHLAHS